MQYNTTSICLEYNSQQRSNSLITLLLSEDISLLSSCVTTKSKYKYKYEHTEMKIQNERTETQLTWEMLNRIKKNLTNVNFIMLTPMYFLVKTNFFLFPPKYKSGKS